MLNRGLCGLCVLIWLGSLPLSGYAAKNPKSLSSDFRMKQVMYDPNQITHITGAYGYQTSIEFASNEQIKLVTLGDSTAWQTAPYLNRLFVKPVEDNAKTNMTVMTNKRAYFFQLDTSEKSDALTFLVRFAYPNMTYEEASRQVVASIEDHLSEMNWRYSTSGDKAAFALKKVFDDGQFTYFLFEEDTDIPSVYVVDHEGYEAIVNTRREGKYLVVERTNNKFTLRIGKSHLCVRNDALLTQSSMVQTENR